MANDYLMDAFMRLRQKLKVMSGRILPDADGVDDVLQDSFVSILTSLSDFEYRGEGSLKSWISKIVTNRALDWLKEHDEVKMTDDIPEEAAEDYEPEVEKIPPDVLNWMIGRLPAGYRAVLNLYVFEQLSHKQIAQRLGIKEATSASQYYHAKQMLAEMIRKYISKNKI